MPNIEVGFNKFMPSLGVYYNYFEILKIHGYVKDIGVKEIDNFPRLVITRKNEGI